MAPAITASFSHRTEKKIGFCTTPIRSRGRDAATVGRRARSRSPGERTEPRTSADRSLWERRFRRPPVKTESLLRVIAVQIGDVAGLRIARVNRHAPAERGLLAL